MLIWMLLSVSGLLRLIFIMAGVILLIRLVTYLVLPHVVGAASERLKNQMDAMRRAQESSDRKEGEVTITRRKDAPAADRGEYTDYTEVKD